MSITMYDSVTIAELPNDAAAYAGYVDGDWPDYSKIRARFPHAEVLSIAVSASGDADCLDVETGDATISQVYGWFRRQVERGIWKPCIYIEQSRLGSLHETMSANGIDRSAYRIWSAHYDGRHVCSPAACDAALAVDGTQWTYQALGRNLDESELNDGFFYVTPKPVPEPKPVPIPVPEPQPAPAPIEEVDNMGNINEDQASKAVGFTEGAYKSITFFADPGVIGKGSQSVRVAVHSHTKGFSQIIVVTNVGASKTGVTFAEADVNGVSLMRQGAADTWADVSYYLA